MSKIIVTGGAGFIGSNLVDALIEKGHEVGVVDNLSTGSRENLNAKAKFFELDITNKDNLEKVFDDFRPEAVFHLAAQASVIVSSEKPSQDVQINVIGTINLLECCKQFGVKKFIFSSTGGAIYGDDAPRPTVETATERPISPYGIDKLCAEGFVRFFSSDNLQTVRLRYANVYGPRQNSKGEAGLIAIFSSKMISGEEAQIYGDGTHTRDYVYVGDVVSANLKALESTKSDVYNIGTSKETSVNEVVKTLQKEIGSSSKVVNTPYKAKEQEASSLNAEKAQAELGWRSETTLEEGLQKTIAWFKVKNN